MKLIWSERSKRERDAILLYIAEDSVKAAIDVDRRIQEQCEGLRSFPDSGRIGRVRGTRELVIDRTPYVAAYAVRGDEVYILSVLHSARRWPKRL